MIESIIKDYILPLRQFGLFLDAAIFSFLVYFGTRWWFSVGPKRSQWSPVIAGVLWMEIFYWPANIEAAAKNIMYGLFQAALAMALYTWAEKRGWIDRVGEMIENKFLGGPKQPPVPPAGTTPEIKP